MCACQFRISFLTYFWIKFTFNLVLILGKYSENKEFSGTA